MDEYSSCVNQVVKGCVPPMQTWELYYVANSGMCVIQYNLYWSYNTRRNWVMYQRCRHVKWYVSIVGMLLDGHFHTNLRPFQNRLSQTYGRVSLVPQYHNFFFPTTLLSEIWVWILCLSYFTLLHFRSSEFGFLPHCIFPILQYIRSGLFKLFSFTIPFMIECLLRTAYKYKNMFWWVFFFIKHVMLNG